MIHDLKTKHEKQQIKLIHENQLDRYVFFLSSHLIVGYKKFPMKADVLPDRKLGGEAIGLFGNQHCRAYFK